MSTVEDLISVMYGHYNQLIMSPPHIIIFSNQKCPVNMISKDRWRYFEINKQNMTLKELKV
jgi:hypothetical protein